MIKSRLYSTTLFKSYCFIKGLYGWRNGKVGEYKMRKRMEKWEDKKDLVFSHLYLVGGWKSEKMKNLYIWLRRKMR